MLIIDQIQQLSHQLLPKGRAFRFTPDSWGHTLIKSLSYSENRLRQDAERVLDAILPDNDNFTADDCTDWELRLGLPVSNASVVDRRAAIQRKMNHPGTIKARQHYKYLEGQLQAANFNVSVFENRFSNGSGGYITQTPIMLSSGGGVVQNQHNDYQHGQAQHGGTWAYKIANSIDPKHDLTFDVGNNLRSTFFIGANPVGSWAYIPKVRETEFRQLVLKLKPAQTVAYLFIVFI
jgi:hypothetical protein